MNTTNQQIMSNINSLNKTNLLYVEGEMGCGKLNTVIELCKKAKVAHMHIDLDQIDMSEYPLFPYKALENKLLIVSGVKSKADIEVFKDCKMVLVGEKCPADLKTLVELVKQ